MGKAMRQLPQPGRCCSRRVRNSQHCYSQQLTEPTAGRSSSARPRLRPCAPCATSRTRTATCSAQTPFPGASSARGQTTACTPVSTRTREGRYPVSNRKMVRRRRSVWLGCQTLEVEWPASIWRFIKAGAGIIPSMTAHSIHWEANGACGR